MTKKVVIITGAAMGMGYAAAERFCRGGWQVEMLDWNGDALEESHKKLADEGYSVDAYVCDVSNYDNCKKVVDSVDDKYGRIDALYNNAGVLGDRLGVLEFDPVAVKQAFEVNVFGGLNMIQLVAKVMVKRKIEGSIINTTSINAEVATWDPIGYIGTKGAMKALTQGAAFQLGEYKIRVNAVSPGAVNTPLAVASWECPAVKEELASMHMRNMWLQPEMIANVAYFLASEESYGVNGTVIDVDDGYARSKSVDFAPHFAAWEKEKAEKAAAAK